MPWKFINFQITATFIYINDTVWLRGVRSRAGHRTDLSMVE